LQLFEQRLPHWPARLRVELERQVALAREVAADARGVSPAIADALAAAADHGHTLLADGDARPAQWQHAARQVGGIVDALVRVAQDGDEPRRRRIEAAVLDAADSVLTLQRAWFLPQGWEPDPKAVPTLEQVLQRGASSRP
jgi:hypothetical protein